MRYIRHMHRSAIIFALLLSLVLCAAASAASPYQDIGDIREYKLIDDADVFSEEQAEELAGLLASTGARHRLDVVAVTLSELLPGMSEEATADDIFDYGGYGVGSSRDGILFLVSLNDRRWQISTRGRAISEFTDSRLKAMEDAIIPYLKAGDWYGAVKRFAELCDGYLAGTISEPFSIPGNIIFAAVVALIIGGIVVATMASALKSVASKAGAADYLRAGSLVLTTSSDRFLYSTVTKVAKPKKSSGSSTHTSSSGSSHGGRGGGF